MTKKSTAELQAEAKDLRKRLAALKEIEAAKKERKALEKEVQDLHRSTSLKWKILKRVGEEAKKAGGAFAEETRDLINGDEDEKEEDKGESLL